MSENIKIEKEVFDKNIFPKVINNQFTQLISNVDNTTPVFTIDDFFELYEQLFYQIPKEGDVNSHNYIIQKEADYLDVIISQDDIQALLDEITNLRQELLNSQTIINELNKVIKK
jgi:hypothetical protein